MSHLSRPAAVFSSALFITVLAVIGGPAAAAEPSAVGAAVSCTKLGPDSDLTVSGTYRVKNPGCAPGPWQTVKTQRGLHLTDGDYVEVRGAGSSCSQGRSRGTVGPDGSTYCGPAWETRFEPASGFN